MPSSFADIRDDFLRFTADIVYCTVVGWGDMSAYQPEGVAHPLFQPLRLRPWRIQVLRAGQLAAGDFHPRIWQDAADR